MGEQTDVQSLREIEADADSLLVAEALAGDEQAFSALMERYGQPILSLCLASTLDREEARDLAQEVFLLAWRHLPRFRGESAFSTWLFALARNTCVDAARRRAARPALAHRDSVAFPGQQLSAAGADPTIAAIFSAASRLPDVQREACLLRDLQGLRYDEISALQGVPVGTVRSRIAAARRTIANEVAR
jgi:RNA polymerase sigma-70 factor (ECF subfamily)